MTTPTPMGITVEDAPTFVKPDSKASAKPSLTDKARDAFKPKPPRTPKFEHKEEIPYPPGGYKEGLAAWYAGVGLLAMPVDENIGNAFIDNAEKCAESVDKIAKKNPRIRKALNYLLTTSDYGELIFAHLPIIFAIFAYSKKPREEKQHDFNNVVSIFRGFSSQPEDNENIVSE